MVDPRGGPPSNPNVSSAGQCTVDTVYIVTFVSTDPDGDPIRYAIDWDANGTVDEFVPPTGHVSSSRPQSASCTYSTSGTKTIRVLAMDADGLTSGWTNYSFGCREGEEGEGREGEGVGEASLPSVPDLSLRVIPSLVRSGDTTKIFWSAANVASCTVTGDNGDSFSGALSREGGETSSPITKRTTYTLSCIDLEEETQTKTATVNIAPAFSES